MAVAEKHGQYSAELFNDGMGAAVVFDGQLRSSISTGTDLRVESTDGQPFPTHQAIYAQEPMASLQSYSISTIMNEVSVTGECIKSDTNTGFKLFAYKRDCPTRAVGAVHRAYQIREGLLIPERISCDHRGDATLDYRAEAIYDGINQPIVIIENQAIPTAPDNNERYTLGPLTVGGATYDEITNASVEFGLNVTRESADSDLWPTHVSVDDVIASITFTGIDVTWFADARIPFAGGKVTTHVNGIFYLKRRDKTTISQFSAGIDHISITFDGQAVISQAFDASGQTAATCTMTIPLVYDGTNTPLTVNTGVALP